jgi:hypothetical protein
MSSVESASVFAHRRKQRNVRASIESGFSVAETLLPEHAKRKDSLFVKAVRKIAQAAKEHHQSVNAAFDAVHGTSYYYPERRGMHA